MLNYKVVGAKKQYDGSPYAIAEEVKGLTTGDGTAVEFYWGDITGDNKVNLSDAGAALNYKVVGAKKQYDGSPYAIAEEVTLYK